MIVRRYGGQWGKKDEGGELKQLDAEWSARRGVALSLAEKEKKQLLDAEHEQHEDAHGRVEVNCYKNVMSWEDT